MILMQPLSVTNPLFSVYSFNPLSQVNDFNEWHNLRKDWRKFGGFNPLSQVNDFNVAFVEFDSGDGTGKF